MCRKNHSLLTTWTNPAEGDKTVSNCVIGAPLIFCSGKSAWVYIRPKSGCKEGRSSGDHYYLGPSTGGYGGPFNFIVIPTATSVVVNLSSAGDETIYIYTTK